MGWRCLLLLAGVAHPLPASAGRRENAGRRPRTAGHRGAVILEKNLRRSTALDRLYHIERLARKRDQTYGDRTAVNPADGSLVPWAFSRLSEDATRPRWSLRQAETFALTTPVLLLPLRPGLVLDS